LEKYIRAFLRGKSRGWLQNTLRRPLLASAIALAVATGAANQAHAVELSDVAQDDIAVAGDSGGFVINGVTSGDLVGIIVSDAGDVNGDGLGDVVVKRYYYDSAAEEDVAEMLVVFGKADGNAINLADIRQDDVSVPGDSGGFRIQTFGYYQRFGETVSGAGDVNGDGLDDILIGVPRGDTDGNLTSDNGKSFVVFGKADGNHVSLADIAQNDVAVAGDSGGFVMNGIDQFDSSGSAVSSAGDVNGDGLDDLLIGAPNAAGANSVYGGEAYVVFGKADGNAVELSEIAQDDAVVAGDSGGFIMSGFESAFGFYEYTGRALSGAGDVNGDGLDDVIISTPYADPGGIYFQGQSYVVFGKADGNAVSLEDIALDANAGGFAINGVGSDDRSGSNLSGAGDVNGDGLADLLIGAPRENEDYVVFGKADGTAVELADIVLDDSVVEGDSGGFVISGSIAIDDVGGTRISDVGDINGDGFDDVIIGSPLIPYDFYNGFNGQAHVVFGKADGAPVDLAALGGGGIEINGIDPFDYAGFSVSGAGDVNGDGVPDLLISALGGDPNGVAEAGEAYVVFGVSAEATVAGMVLDIEQLLDDGDINNGVANPLLKILGNVLDSLDRDDTEAACNQLADFITTTQDKIDDGKLDAGDGQALIDSANSVRSQLGC
jgi:hypothetical protein